MMLDLTPEAVQYLEQLGIPIHGTASAQSAAGRAAWRALHEQPLGDPAWFAQWQQRIPSGCGCHRKANDLLADYPPCYDSPEAWFAWTVEYHNAVNAKLSKPTMPIELARALWRDEPWIQPPIDSVVAVTSLSPLPHHREVQDRCLQSWRDFGLQIVAGNTREEITALRDAYPQVTFVAVSASRSFPRATPRVFDLIQAAADGPMLVINSDIEILGPQSRLLDLVARRQTAIGIRHNWETHRVDATIERWGYDAFLLYPEDVATLPDLDFAIGQPMWDWWIPVHLDSVGVSIEYLADPFLYHLAHAIHWDNASIAIGHGMLAAAYGLPADHSSLEQWRFARPHSILAEGRKPPG